MNFFLFFYKFFYQYSLNKYWDVIALLKKDDLTIDIIKIKTLLKPIKNLIQFYVFL